MTDLVCIAALLSGLLGAMGLGGGSILIIYLTLFAQIPQKQAQGTNLLFFIPCALISILFNLKNRLVKPKTAAFVIIGGLIGVGAGAFAVGRVEPRLLGKIFGGFVIAMGVITLFSKGDKDKNAG